MNQQEFRKEYEKTMHQLQTGVAMEMEHDTHSVEPKHLRVGINSALCETSALGDLMIAKGVITQEEYYDAMLKAVAGEVERYRALLEARLGRKVTLE